LVRIGIIGGTGIACVGGADAKSEHITTRDGPADMVRASYGGRELIFLARHGAGHSIPPHRINYRANIRALREIGDP